MGKKLKYKDVVKKGPPVSKKNPKKIKKGIHKSPHRFKRKSNYHHSDVSKKLKGDEPKIQQVTVEESSESEEEVLEDPLKQLRDSLAGNVAESIISASDTDEEDKYGEDGGDNKGLTEISDDSEDDTVDMVGDGSEQSDAGEENVDEDKEEEDTVDDAKDPFVSHVSYELHPHLLSELEAGTNVTETILKTWSVLGNIIFCIPKCEISEDMITSMLDTTVFAKSGKIPQKISQNCSPDDLFIKKQISSNINVANKSLRTGHHIFTPLQQELFSLINNYQDVYFPNRTFDNAEEIMFTYCLHAVNHVLKTRIKVLHHNSKLAKKDDVPDEFRDQGLVRPKVLILAPFKSTAYNIVNTIIDIMFSEDKGNVIKRNRFNEDYTGNELKFPKRNPKPDDYEKLFCGNIGDDFKIGISVTKKSLKLYSDFYASDILIASPLGLRTIIGAEGEPDRDFDFLTSIELLILDQTDVFFMQNWDHVNHLFNHMHLKPKDLHGTDVSRVRQWCLNLWAKYYRQTLIFSSVTLPEINSIFNKKCFNYAGKAKISNLVELGCISQVFVSLPHIFCRFEASSPTDAIEARFNFFVNKIRYHQKDCFLNQILIYVPSYYDYVRIRNYFKKEDMPFVQICEYSKEGKIARARDMFYHGDAQSLLYTERYHFYNRIRVKGIRKLMFYQPPNLPNFYHEMCNFMQEINMNKTVGSTIDMTVTVLYSKYDIMQLAAIVGSKRASRMCEAEKGVHILVTGSD